MNASDTDSLKETAQPSAPLRPAVPAAWKPYMTGRCFDFALALHKLLPGSQLVAFGRAKFPDHVAVQLGEGEGAQLLDVRGPLPMEQMVAGMQGSAQALSLVPIPVTVDQVALHMGYTAGNLRLPADVRRLAKERLEDFRDQLDLQRPSRTSRRRP